MDSKYEYLYKKYQLSPCLSYIQTNDGNLISVYSLDNSPYILETMVEDDVYKQLNVEMSKLAEYLYSKCSVMYSQKNEFYID